MKTRTSWREKLERVEHAKVVQIPPRMQPRFGEGTMLIPRPLDVDALIRSIPKGKVVTQTELRERLAADARASVACPLTTGIFVRIAAEAAEEDARAGKKQITPYWRVVRDNGSMNPKFPGGPEAQARRLSGEGLTIRNGRVLELDRVSARLS